MGKPERMSSGLEAIQSELRRLQREGVDRVFVNESTLDLLQPSATPTEKEVVAGDASAINVIETSTAPIAPQLEPKTAKVASPQAKIKALPKEAASFELPSGDARSQMAWLKERVEACPVCKEHLRPEGKIVFGTGSVEADIFFCGEAPGADEEREGEPFVGKAGQLLNKIIQAMGLAREEVYLANILKWRPEHDKPYGNRPPTLEEMDYCLPYVRAQIDIIRPKVIVALGNTAVSGLLGPDPNRRMGAIRGTWHSFQGIPLMITFHPSYLLRNDTLKTKRMVWEDLLQVMEKATLPISDKQRGFFLPKA